VTNEKNEISRTEQRMNAKENALRIMTFDHPEKVVSGCPTCDIGYLGCNHEGYAGGGPDLPVGSVWRDIWDVEWHKEQAGVMGFPKGHPLSDPVADLAKYAWPNPDDERIVGHLYDEARSWHREEAFLKGSHRDTLWEKCYMLMGMENAMCCFYAEPQAMRDTLRGIMDFQMGIARHYLKAGVEMVGMTDDLGTQIGLLLSPDIIREFLLPEYRRLFSLYKARGVRVSFHSCGHIEPILDLFMELGVDTLNPVQATANCLESVRLKTAGRMALQGGIPSGLIMSGPVDAIRAEVRRRIPQLGREGGYFCAPDQSMPWPEPHIVALREAVEEFGTYPIPIEEEHI
jgi:uroporphyrinogen decarboxylase